MLRAELYHGRVACGTLVLSQMDSIARVQRAERVRTWKRYFHIRRGISTSPLLIKKAAIPALWLPCDLVILGLWLM